MMPDPSRLLSCRNYVGCPSGGVQSCVKVGGVSQSPWSLWLGTIAMETMPNYAKLTGKCPLFWPSSVLLNWKYFHQNMDILGTFVSIKLLLWYLYKSTQNSKAFSSITWYKWHTYILHIYYTLQNGEVKSAKLQIAKMCMSKDQITLKHSNDKRTLTLAMKA